MKSDSYQIYALSENALTVKMSPVISEEQIRTLYLIRKRIIDINLSDIFQVLVTFHELTVIYDSSSLTFESLRETISECIELNGMQTIGKSPANDNLFKIPICYDEEMAIDRSRMEQHTGFSFQEIITRHHQTTYTFFMMGFLPGFLYLGGLDERLVCPRLKEPRQKVLTGSVGIADRQTGIYPMDSPGGWNIIGRTPLSLFDYSQSEKEEKVWIKPLDKIQFVPIKSQDFGELMGMTPGEYQLINKSE